MSGLGRLIHRITTGDILSEVASNISTLITKKKLYKMAMTWELVKQVIKTINTSRETAIKIGTENVHEDYMFVTETRLAVGEEVIEEWEQEFERDKYRIEDYKLIYEDRDIILWKELGSYGDGKRAIKTVSMFFKRW